MDSMMDEQYAEAPADPPPDEQSNEVTMPFLHVLGGSENESHFVVAMRLRTLVGQDRRSSFVYYQSVIEEATPITLTYQNQRHARARMLHF